MSRKLTDKELDLLFIVLQMDIRYYEKRWMLAWLGYKTGPCSPHTEDLMLSRMLPDWCANCGEVRTKVEGGRIRKHCPSCKTTIYPNRIGLVSEWFVYGGTSQLQLLTRIELIGAL